LGNHNLILAAERDGTIHAPSRSKVIFVYHFTIYLDSVKRAPSIEKRTQVHETATSAVQYFV
jgi:hypothetical protein